MTRRMLAGSPALLLFVLLSLLAGPTAFAGPLKSFREWTNDLGERVFGFESNCPRSRVPYDRFNVEFQAACRADADLTFPGNVRDIGVTVEQAEEWIWLKEAMLDRSE